MLKRIRKYQVVKMLEAEDFQRLHTFQKCWREHNGYPRYGWFIATLYGWTHIGSTLEECAEELTLQREEREYNQAQYDKWLAEEEAAAYR
jgi:hypothetical protein